MDQVYRVALEWRHNLVTWTNVVDFTPLDKGGSQAADMASLVGEVCPRLWDLFKGAMAESIGTVGVKAVPWALRRDGQAWQLAMGGDNADFAAFNAPLPPVLALRWYKQLGSGKVIGTNYISGLSRDWLGPQNQTTHSPWLTRRNAYQEQITAHLNAIRFLGRGWKWAVVENASGEYQEVAYVGMGFGEWSYQRRRRDQLTQ